MSGPASRQAKASRTREQLLDFVDDAAGGRFMHPPGSGDVEVGAINAPVLQGGQQLIFGSEFGLPAAFTGALQSRLEDLDHGLEGFRSDAAQALELSGFEVFDVTVAIFGPPASAPITAEAKLSFATTLSLLIDFHLRLLINRTRPELSPEPVFHFPNSGIVSAGISHL